MTDKYIDLLAEREAEKAKKSGNQKLYDNHEQRSLANLNATRAEAGKPPLTLEQVKAMKKKQNSGLLGAFDENPLGF